MIRVFDRLPYGASPAYEVGTNLGVFIWDPALAAWSKKEVGEEAERRGHCHVWLPRPPLLPSLEDAKDELKRAESAVPEGLGMIVSWADHGPDGVLLAMAACELADLEYGTPVWAS